MFHEWELLLETYVDDPNAAVAGTTAEKDRLLALMVVPWSCLGYKPAFANSSRGSVVDWRDCTLAISPGTVTAKIRKAITDDLLQDLIKMRKQNLISAKEIQSIAGRIAHVALLLTTWRPFLQIIFGAMTAVSKTTSPTNTIWTKQVALGVRLVHCFSPWVPRRDLENLRCLRICRLDSECVHRHRCISLGPRGLVGRRWGNR